MGKNKRVCGTKSLPQRTTTMRMERKLNPYKTLEKQLQAWLHQLPVLGFNWGKYDLNTIKRFFVPLLICNSDTEHASCFVIKRQNSCMCLSTYKLKFIDLVNYLAPGYSYHKYLKAYVCELEKGHFPYEYMDDLLKLDDRALPPQEAFYSRLKNEAISDEDYALCQVAWCDNGMKTMRDFLLWYNNRDVIPFIQAIDKQFAFYQQHNIDMFKDGISIPGLTLLYLFKDFPSKTYFNRTNSDLHQLVKNNIVGGPAIIFHRYHEKDITKIRGEETCRSIVGYDANALYMWALMQDMPTGWYMRRRVDSRGERIPSSTSPTVRTDGRPVANLGIGPNGIQHPSSGQWTGEANWQTSGRRVVCKDAYCISVSCSV